MSQPPQPPQPAKEAQQAPTPSTVYVSFSAEINANTTESLIAAISNMVNKGVKQVYLMISTPGGSVMNGMNLYNVLKALQLKYLTKTI